MTIERRSKIRFPLKFAVRYRTFGAQPAVGDGTTVDFCSSGILVGETRVPSVQFDAVVEVVVEWPILRDGTIPIQFVALGRVVRVASYTFAIAITRHEFQIPRKQSSLFSPGRERREIG
jgi:hypothetical protein